MLFEMAKNSNLLQDFVINMMASVHPAITHNLEKMRLIKKALFYCDIDGIEGGYFEFGVFEGSSLFSAVQSHRKMKSLTNKPRIKRMFYGFDSFDEGFKYNQDGEEHATYEEGGFVSSYAKALKRFQRFDNVKLIKGYFEDTVHGQSPEKMLGESKCAVIFIDCDLKGPAEIALDFIRPILQKGSVIILDDYWSYRGDESKGVCGALKTFLEKNQSVKLRDYMTYGSSGKSFIVTDI